MKKILILIAGIFISAVSYCQFVYTIKADSVKLTNDSCNTELIIENATRNVCGFLFNKGNGRTEFRRVLTPIGINKYLVGCDTLDLSGVTGGSNILAKDGLLRTVDSLYLGNIISGSGPHNFTTNRYQYLNNYFYSIGGTVNDPVTQPVFRFYNNGDFTAKATNNLTGNGPNANGIRYTSKYGLFEVGTSNNFDTTLATNCCGSLLKSAIIINSDFVNTIKGHVHGSIMGGDNITVDSTGALSWSAVFGESHVIKSGINKSMVAGYGQKINYSMYGSVLGGIGNNINAVFNYGVLNGAFNTVADSSSFAIVNGINNVFGGINQLIIGTGNTNKSPFGVTIGNKSVDFSTFVYPGNAASRFALQSVSNLQNYPLFVLANSYANESNNAVRSNAITTLFNGRTQINTTGFSNNLTQSDVTPKAALEVVSTNSGVLLPKLTTAQRNAIAAGDLYDGLLLYNTDLSKFQFYKANVWVSIGDSLSSGTTNGWSTTGNLGTVGGTNFIGTIDNVPINFRVNNALVGTIGSTASYNVSLGALSLPNTSTGIKNTALGGGALRSNTTGYNNSAIGYTTLYNNTTGFGNTANGWAALGYNKTGNNNTAMGNTAMNTSSGAETFGSYNTAIGYAALGDLFTGDYDIGIGARAGLAKTGTSNTLYISDSTYHMKYKLDSVGGIAPSVIGKDGNGYWHVYQSPSGSGGGGGTVTSVGTGYGLSGGTITSAGTIAVDSAALSLKYLRIADTAGFVHIALPETITGQKRFTDTLVLAAKPIRIETTNNANVSLLDTRVTGVTYPWMQIKGNSAGSQIIMGANNSASAADMMRMIADYTDTIWTGTYRPLIIDAYEYLTLRANRSGIGAPAIRFAVGNNINNYVATFDNSGHFSLPKYGTGSITGTAAYNLATDASGNVIEVATGGGGSTVQEDGIPLTLRPILNFNYGVKATDNSGSSRTDVDVNLSTNESFLASDVSMTSSATFYDGGSVVLSAGKWMIMTTGTIESTNNAAMRITGKVWDGTNVYAAGESSSNAMGAAIKGYVTMSLSSIITVASNTTIKASYTSTLANCKIKSTPGDNNTGTAGKTSSIRAIRIN